MQCYEFTETIRRGIRIEYPLGLLLRLRDEDAHIQIPLADDTRAWLSSELRVVPDGMTFLFLRAEIHQGEDGPCIETGPYSNRALILVRTEPGEGGSIEYRHNHLIEPAITQDRDIYESCSDRLFIARPGGLLRIVRTGSLEGAAAELPLGWDGQWLHDFREIQDKRPVQRTSPKAEPPARPIRNGLVRLAPTVQAP